MCSCQSSYTRDVRGIRGIFRLSTGQRPSTPARDIVRLLEQRRRSFHRIFGQRTTLTLIWLITGSGASSNSECTSRGCMTLTNWNSACCKCGVMSTRASLTMQLTSGGGVFVRACRRTADTSSICCRKQYDYLQSTVWQRKRFIFVNYDTLFDFFAVVICNKFELLTFPR